MMSNKTLKNNCDDLMEIIADYAFALTDAEENRRVEMGLPDCPEAVAQLNDYRELQVVLREAVPQVAPPPQLEARLMAAIGAPATPPPFTVAPRNSRLPWWIAAAAVFALLFTNTLWLVTQIMNDDDGGFYQPEEGDETFVLTSAEGLRWVWMPPAQEGVNAGAFMVWDEASQAGLLCVLRFPELEAGQTYQLWLNRGDESINAGTFTVNPNGNGVHLFQVSDAIDDFDGAWVSLEPESGSDQPSDPALVQVEF